MIITQHAFARAGLVGNPSDGYFGKTISFVIRNFRATVSLWESPYFEIVPTHGDLARFDSVRGFLRDQKLYGYYGGVRLMKAAIKRFHDYCRQNDIDLPDDKSFTISYQSDIPRLVGLAGSSAIIVATMRALTQFYSVDVPKHYLPTLVLSCERDELGISAGLQDRVIQVYEGMVYASRENAATVRRVRSDARGGERCPASQPARTLQSRRQDGPRRHANLPRADGSGQGGAAERQLGRARQSRQREFRSSPKDHEHRAGESADGRGGAIDRRQLALLRQRRGDLRAVQGWAAVSGAVRRARGDPVYGDSAACL
jgi:hypothetical protein